uniref:1-alkyl-2-acetylglycerophosphocholine esterase n=1 Tax=Oxyrrhis marina TaxID=2969 RepID=A0A7S4LQ75_OXYMA
MLPAMKFTLVWTVAAATCPGQEQLLPNPADPSVRGPYPVGSVLGSLVVPNADGIRSITVEAWYPAKPGSDAGQDPWGYDIRVHTPPKQRAKLANVSNVTYQACGCYRDLPVADGVFPVVVYIHGTAAFRTESLHQQTHWASRGFVVVAADHPGIQLYDLLNVVNLVIPPKTDQAGDARGVLKGLATPGGIAGFKSLEGHMDMERVGITGHSAGGMACRDLGDVADVLIPMAGYAPVAKTRLKSTLVLAARNDTIVDYPGEVSAYKNCDVTPKRFASVDALGHLFCSDLCWVGARAGGVVQIALDAGIKVAGAFKSLGQNGCSYLNKTEGTHFLGPQCGWQLVNYASAAAFEEVLRCDSGMASKLTHIKSEMPIPAGCPKTTVFDFQEQLSAGVVV